MIQPDRFSHSRQYDPDLELQVFYYDNNGNQDKFDGDQYAWNTSFANIGLRLRPNQHIELLSQYLFGNTKMGTTPSGQSAVDNDFDAFFLLASAQYKPHRISVRFDRFGVDDRDGFRLEDDNQEDGHAWTLAYFYRLSKRHRFGLELLRIDSARPVRRELGLPADEIETQIQLSYRLLLRS